MPSTPDPVSTVLGRLELDLGVTSVPKLEQSSPLRHVAKAWLTHFGALVRQDQKSLSALKSFARSAPRFAPLLEEPIHGLRCSVVLDWHAARCEKATSATAFSDYVALRACLSFARHRDLLVTNPASALGIGHKPAPSNPVRPSQIEPLRAALETMTLRRGHWLAARRHHELEAVAMYSSIRAVELLEESGRRIAEICKILVQDVWLEERVIMLPRTKTGPSALVLTERSAARVERQLQELAGRSPYLFPSPVSWDQHIGVKTVWETCHEACGLAGISDVHPHDLRHGFAWAALRGGASLENLSRTLGHEKTETTKKIYGQGFYTVPGMWEVAELVESMKTARRLLDPLKGITEADFQAALAILRARQARQSGGVL